MNKILRKIRKTFYLNQIRPGPRFGLLRFTVQGEGLSRRELLIKAFREILQNPKIDFDQLILYPTFIHVSFVSKEKNRRGIIQAQGNGKLGYGRLSRVNALKIQ